MDKHHIFRKKYLILFSILLFLLLANDYGLAEDKGQLIFNNDYSEGSAVIKTFEKDESPKSPSVDRKNLLDININSFEMEIFGWEIILTGDKNYNASLGEIYDDKENGILVFIKSCDRSKRASLKFADEHVKIRFIDEECDVKSVYKNITPVSFERRANINRVSTDWYKIVEDDVYVRTKTCFESLFLEEEVTLAIKDNKDIFGSIGQIIFESGNKCEILGIYKKADRYDLRVSE